MTEMQTGYMVEAPSYDHNDEHMTQENGVQYENLVYLDKSVAEARAKVLNVQFAKEVLGDPGDWFFDEGMGSLVDDQTFENAQRLYKLLRPVSPPLDTLREIAEALNADDGPPEYTLEEADYEWLVATFGKFQSHRVVEVYIEGSAT